MKMLFNVPKRLVLTAIPTALMLTLSFAGVAGATADASASSSTVINPCFLLVSPLHQIAVVGSPAAINIKELCTAQTTQVYPLYPEAYFLVAWGDGSVSTYPYCLEVCPVSIPPFGTVHAVHTYQVTGDYHPETCLIEPSPYVAPSCTAVEIDVKGKA
jgi:hypothetical protein